MTNNKIPVIRGAGGGKSGGSGSSGKEDADNLHSKQIATIIDALCEGPIEGIINGQMSIFMNETALQNRDGTGQVSTGAVQPTDGSFNFVDVGAQWNNGTQDQLPFAGVDGVESETSVSVLVTHDTPVIRTISNLTATSARVTVGVPGLSTLSKSDGSLKGASVSLSIDVRPNNGSWIRVINDTINGKTVSHYQRAYRIALPGEGPWDLRLTRNTADATTSTLTDKIYFDSYTAIVEASLSYPNTAMAYLRMDSTQFSSVPTRAYGIKGLIISVPSNYDPKTRTYSGLWDGSFKQAWTDNPAWCFYDLATNVRYGTGARVKAESIDKWSLYTIAKYCDEMVPSGYTDTSGNPILEPRFTCNLYLQTREEAYKVLQNFASIFRAITFWGATAVVAMQNAPSDPVALYTNANVIDGAFNYSGTSLSQRHTVQLISWNDPADFYRQKVEYVQDDEAIRLYGVIQNEVSAMGCASKGQAHRLGKWMLAIERYATETVSFKAGLDGALLYPGIVIESSDILRAGVRMGGRLVDASNSSIKLDKAMTLAPGVTYTASVVMPDGSIATRPIVTSTGTTVTLMLGSALPALPVQNAIFVITANNLVPETWRVLSVKESSKNTAEVTALTYVPQIYDYVEKDIAFEQTPVSALKAIPDPVQDIALVPARYIVDGQLVGISGVLGWNSLAGKFKVQWRVVYGVWQSADTYNPSFDLDNLTQDEYEFIVTPYALSGQLGLPTNYAVNVGALLAAIPVVLDPAAGGGTALNPVSLVLETPADGKGVVLSWSQPPGAQTYTVQVGLAATDRAADFAIIRTVEMGNVRRFTYDVADMRADGGPWRNLVFRVFGHGALGAATSTYSETRWLNPQIGALQNITFKSGVACIYFSASLPLDSDFSGVNVYIGETSGFAADPTNLVYSGPGSTATITSLPNGVGLSADVIYYFKAAGYDILGQDELIISDQYPAHCVSLAAAAGLNVATVYAYQRSDTIPVGTPGAIVYDFSHANITIPAVLLNGWQRTMPEGDSPLYVTAASASNQSLTDNIAANEWSGAVVLAKDGENYSTTVESTNGTIFRVGQAKTTDLIAHVFKNGVDVTDALASSQFQWRRVSLSPQPAPNDDATWNAQYASGYKKITLTIDSVNAKATFHCDILI